MNDRRRPWGGVPVSELAFVVALILAIIGLSSLGTSRGTWAMVGATVLSLLAGLEIGGRQD